MLWRCGSDVGQTGLTQNICIQGPANTGASNFVAVVLDLKHELSENLTTFALPNSVSGPLRPSQGGFWG